MILGLKRGEVVLAAHQHEWSWLFEEEKRLLREVLGTSLLAIEHIGSTAVTDLSAKPVIDIAILVGSFEDIEPWPEILDRHGYTYWGDREGRNDHFFAKGPDESRTYYLHVVAVSGVEWDNYLKFRDALRNQPQIRIAYEKLKQQALAAYRHDRKAYTQAKHDFIQSVLNGPLLPPCFPPMK